MNIQKFTQKSIEAIQAAQSYAAEYGNQEITQEHLLYALLTQQEGLIPELIRKSGASPENNSKERNESMEESRRILRRAGAQSLTLGVLTLVFGVTVGVLGIVNGGRLLHEQRKLR